MRSQTFSPTGNHTIPAFCTKPWQYSDEDAMKGASNAEGMKNAMRFSTNIWLYLGTDTW